MRIRSLARLPFALVLVALCSGCGAMKANQVDERVQALENRVTRLETQVQALEKAQK